MKTEGAGWYKMVSICTHLDRVFVAVTSSTFLIYQNLLLIP